ncbi:hypothetical protein [Paenibacillus crassostreae]|uniref:Uncharacterized protein n=1 Tax=Paenibacillus crassostreae TaxID=1763538 RepID=A0A167EVJ0_9BACL|nr:hypothetical protein [Paenibacillus crassostreae]AOZ93426.1 hypothetical protein LPB68_15265 [Paenibacillus crassostreae]OAB75919.1 hypothetical protein PNBC_07755 [Paenibacillus crassostreae]
MTRNVRFYHVIGQLLKDDFKFKVDIWRLLIETNRYYEIKHTEGTVKRIYKEKINTIYNDTHHYSNGFLSCSAFCMEDQIHKVQMGIIQNLKHQVDNYMNDLLLNKKEIEKKYLISQDGTFKESNIIIHTEL